MTEIKRLNYFKSQFLQVEDFTAEQAYHIQKLRLHNQWLHSWGVAGDGLQVGKKAAKQIEIGNGIAIDRNGNEVVLLDPILVDLSNHTARATVWVTARFEQVKLPGDLYPGGAVDHYTRTTERTNIEHGNEAPVADGSVVLLAMVTLDASGNIDKIDNGVRRLAGAASSSGMRIVGPPRTAGANTLDVQGEPRRTVSGGVTGFHPTGLALYVTAGSDGAGKGVEFKHSNGTQGIGFGYNTIYATGPFANQPLYLKAFGTASVIVQGNAAITGNLSVNVIAPNGDGPNLPLKLNAKGTGGLILTGDTTVNGSLETTDNATLNKNLTVKGTITGKEVNVETGIKAKSIEADSIKISNNDLVTLIATLQTRISELEESIKNRISSADEGQLRIVRGTVWALKNPLQLVGRGFAMTHVSTGLYKITFQPAFKEEPSASVTQIYPADTGKTTDNAIIRWLDRTSMTIAVGRDDGTLFDRAFSFVVVGPQ